MPRIARIATAVPDLDFEQDYRRWALRRLEGRREARLYERIMDEARRIQRIEAERDTANPNNTDQES